MAFFRVVWEYTAPTNDIQLAYSAGSLDIIYGSCSMPSNIM